MACRLRREWRVDDHGATRIFADLFAHWLVGHELGLEYEIGGSIDWLHLIEDGRQRAMHQRDHACGAEPDHAMSGRLPLQGAAQDARLQVQYTFMRPQLSVADVEGLVVDEKP